MSLSPPAPTAAPTPPHEDAWVVLWTQARAEKMVESRLAVRGIEPWLPKFTDRRQWSDRWRNVVLPLFPGYLFARAGSTSVSALLRIPGVLTIVKHGDRPARLADDFITRLREVVERSGVDVTPVVERLAFSVAEEVVVDEGPLRGVRGIVREIRSNRRIVIWVDEIGLGAAFTIGSASVRPVSA